MNAASVAKQIDFYSRFSPSPLSMKQFIDFGKSGIKWIQFSMRIEQSRKEKPTVPCKKRAMEVVLIAQCQMRKPCYLYPCDTVFL